MKLSKGFAQKLIEAQLGKAVPGTWWVTFKKWMVDSKYRQYKRLDLFLKEQLDNPDPTLVEVAEDFKKYPLDRRIVEILRFVRKKVIYEYDQPNFGKEEYWATAEETLARRKDDCDGINGLIYVLARLSGIPQYLLYCVVGDTSSGGHFWTIYYSTSNRAFFVIDGTFYPDSRYIPDRLTFRLADNRYKKIWYIFNDEYAFEG